MNEKTRELAAMNPVQRELHDAGIALDAAKRRYEIALAAAQEDPEPNNDDARGPDDPPETVPEPDLSLGTTHEPDAGA